MQDTGKFAVLWLLLFSAHPAAGEDEHTLGNILHRQAQDIATLMSDVKTIIMRQDSQHEEQAERRGIRGSCAGDMNAGLTTLYVHDHPITAPCDGQGAVVILRRIDNLHNFSGRGWEDYKNGFGNPAGSFWLGLENMHRLTNAGSAKLRVELEAWDAETAWAQYSYVRIEGESTGYRLMLDGYTGNAGDSLTYSNGQKFSTIDVDNDAKPYNCANNFLGGWWHYKCFQALLTGPYVDDGVDLQKTWRGIIWKDWKGSNYSYKKVELKLILG